jgi:hypothetical protein
VATLLQLRLLARTTAAAASAGMFDRFEGVKLRCNIEWETAEALGKSVGFKVAERMWEDI